jgi:hypothetical protein
LFSLGAGHNHAASTDFKIQVEHNQGHAHISLQMVLHAGVPQLSSCGYPKRKVSHNYALLKPLASLMSSGHNAIIINKRGITEVGLLLW